jgi:hypothetical protein
VIRPGANRYRLLAWLAIVGGEHHPGDVVRLSAAGPRQGWSALADLVAAGLVARRPGLHPAVWITGAGRRAAAQLPRGVAYFTRRSVTPDGASLRHADASGRCVLNCGCRDRATLVAGAAGAAGGMDAGRSPAPTGAERWAAVVLAAAAPLDATTARPAAPAA